MLLTNWPIILHKLQLLGTPTEADLGFLQNEDARRYIRQLPPLPRQPLKHVFPHVNPLAIDLIEKMLTFDPTRRITGKLFITCVRSIHVSKARCGKIHVNCLC